MNLTTLTRKTINIALDTVFPLLCLACHTLLKNQNEKDLFLCKECQEKITINNSLFCLNCKRRIPSPRLPISLSRHPPAGGSGQDVGCLNIEPTPRTKHPSPTKCCSSPLPLASATSYGNETIRELIYTLKYKQIKTAIKPIKELIIKPHLRRSNFLSFLSFRAKPRNLTPHKNPTSPTWLITPIPLHKRKERKRGFNQAAIIAEALRDSINPIRPIKPMRLIGPINLLRRTRNTTSQTETKTNEEREKNIKECFEIQPHVTRYPLRAPILLVDDVTTSGATVKEAARTLKNVGAKKILAFTVANAS